jgi:ribosomal protein S18 acetylase RimI-like enzyme
MEVRMVIVRRAREADLDLLVRLLRALFAIEADFAFDEAKQRHGLRLLLGDERACLLVAEAESGVVGMCSGQLVISTAEGGPSVLVEDVVVDESFRGRGIGRLLMEELTRWARAGNASRLQLLADRHNTPALEFYRRLGWAGTDLICLRTATVGGNRVDRKRGG